MTRSQKKTGVAAEANEASENVAEAVPAGNVQHTQVHIDAIALRSLKYEELPTSEPLSVTGTQSQRLSLSLSMAGEIKVAGQAVGGPRVELVLRTQIVPDKTVRPVNIEVELSALFSADEGVAFESLLKFVNSVGVRIMFPYLREVVTTITARGIYGPIFLDPSNVGAMMTDEKIQEVIDAQRSAALKTES